MASNGRIMGYNGQLGYGFIQRGDGDFVFVHDSSVENGDLLEEGNEVEFAIAQGPQGPMAVNVVEI